MDSQNYPPGPLSGPPPIPPRYASVPPPRPGGGWKIAVFLLAALLFFSVLLHLVSFVGSMLQSGTGAGTHARRDQSIQEVLMEDRDSHHKIAVINVTGLIMDGNMGDGRLGMVESIDRQLKKAGEDAHVRALILKVDSPGGEVLASDEISKAIQDFQEDYEKPVIASMGSLAASGGYYISAPCDWIVANPLTITGSIGVIMQSFNYRGLMDKIGLRPEVFKSGKFKDMMSGMKQEGEISAEERAMIQNLVDQTFQRFKDVVREGRGQAVQRNSADPGNQNRPLTERWEDYADGRILSGQEAFNHGFVDELGDFETAVARAEQLAGIDGANIVTYQEVFDLSQFFRFFTRSESPNRIRLEVGLEPSPLQAGQLYFLSPNYLH